MTDAARREHYGEFYGLREPVRTGGPLLMVYGNCQAEALRVALSGPDVDTLRMPPVHELTADDVPHLHRCLARVDVLVAQPVKDGYRDLPLGTEEVAARLPAGATTTPIPPVRFAGLYPYQELVRAQGLPDPPVVPYHDLRVLAEAAGLPDGPDTLSEQERLTAYQEVARASIAELERRERLHGTIVISDVVAAAGTGAGWTINHPGNEVLLPLARRVRSRLGLTDAVDDPGRVLLRSVRTPLLPEVVQALDLAEAAARAAWVVDGEDVADQDIAAEHTRWYAEHPVAVTAGVEAHADRLRLLGWAG